MFQRKEKKLAQMTILMPKVNSAWNYFELPEVKFVFSYVAVKSQWLLGTKIKMAKTEKQINLVSNYFMLDST